MGGGSADKVNDHYGVLWEKKNQRKCTCVQIPYGAGGTGESKDGVKDCRMGNEKSGDKGSFRVSTNGSRWPGSSCRGSLSMTPCGDDLRRKGKRHTDITRGDRYGFEWNYASA